MEIWDVTFFNLGVYNHVMIKKINGMKKKPINSYFNILLQFYFQQNTRTKKELVKFPHHSNTSAKAAQNTNLFILKASIQKMMSNTHLYLTVLPSVPHIQNTHQYLSYKIYTWATTYKHILHIISAIIFLNYF